MKIDFNASYRELAKVVGASARPVDKGRGGSSFGALLSSIAPRNDQLVEKSKESGTVSEQRSSLQPKLIEDSEPRAALRLSEPELKPPTLLPLSPPEAPVSPEAGGVKSPAVLAVRRVSSSVTRDPAQKAAQLERVGNLVAAAGRTYGIDPSLGMSVVSVESAFDHHAVSQDGFQSKGLFQLLDSTGSEVHGRLGLSEGYNPFHPEQNVEVGIAHLRYLHDVFGEGKKLSPTRAAFAAANSSSLEKLAVAAFNAGEGRVADAQQRALRAGLNPGRYEDIETYLPKITKDYVQKVLSAKNDFDGMFAGGETQTR